MENKEIKEAVDQAVELCRVGELRAARSIFALLSSEDLSHVKVPAAYYGYLGYCVARFERRVDEGVRLCEHAVSLESENPETLLCLAKVHRLTRNRRRSVAALLRGLRFAPLDEGLMAMREEVGVRRAPVLGFLSREHPINVQLGRLRHKLSQRESDLTDDVELD